MNERYYEPRTYSEQRDTTFICKNNYTKKINNMSVLRGSEIKSNLRDVGKVKLLGGLGNYNLYEAVTQQVELSIIIQSTASNLIHK